jgi:hypothetical protein
MAKFKFKSTMHTRDSTSSRESEISNDFPKRQAEKQMKKLREEVETKLNITDLFTILHQFVKYKKNDEDHPDYLQKGGKIEERKNIRQLAIQNGVLSRGLSNLNSHHQNFILEGQQKADERIDEPNSGIQLIESLQYNHRKARLW